MQYSITDLWIFFIIYGFLGFVLESSFRSLVTKSLTLGQGFLTNYFCPLYGICAILIIQIYTACDITLDGRFKILFTATIGSILAVTFMEYIVGLVLDKVFNHKLWDYSQNPVNFKSYICLEFSLMWGIVAIILSSFIHPIIEVIFMTLPEAIKQYSILFTSAILIINASYNSRKYHYFKNIKI
ncbi:MAG: putative ABC transporter permease [Tissierellia bacterium]|nr:putative ABC transporter permease [Tissierellia bacterium]